MLCKLCQSKGAIKNSHIIPQFVSEWIKKTSPLGGLRNVDLPNLRQQDTITMPLLCHDCEERLSSWEARFAHKVFYPFNDKGESCFDYSEWLLYFAVSLSWRVGVSLLQKLQTQSLDAASSVEEALADWRCFLLGQPSKEYAHHLFFDCMHHCREQVGSFYDSRYALGTIDYAIPYGTERVAVFIKLPGMVFFSGVCPPKPEGWKGTRILENGAMTIPEQDVTDRFFSQCMRDGASNVAHSMNAMSVVQKRRLEDRMKEARSRSEIRRDRAENLN